MSVPTQTHPAWPRTRAMARSQGVDLAGAVFDGWFSRAELHALLTACETCGNETICTDWLTRPAARQDLPLDCRNKSGLEDLRL